MISRHPHGSVVLLMRYRGLCAPFVNYSTDAEGERNVLIMLYHAHDIHISYPTHMCLAH